MSIKFVVELSVDCDMIDIINCTALVASPLEHKRSILHNGFQCLEVGAVQLPVSNTALHKVERNTNNYSGVFIVFL